MRAFKPASLAAPRVAPQRRLQVAATAGEHGRSIDKAGAGHPLPEALAGPASGRSGAP